jgi:hypothetical protein
MSVMTIELTGWVVCDDYKIVSVMTIRSCL